MTWNDGIEALPGLVPEFKFDPSKTALVIVDMQNRAVKPDEFEGLARLLQQSYPKASKYYLNRLRSEVVANNQRLLQHFREQQMTVVYLTVGPTLESGSDFISPFNVGYEELRAKTGVRSLFPVGSPPHRIIDELTPLSTELVINKTTSSAFNSTGIDVTLRHLGIDTLVCTGIVTDACVMVTARDASDRGYRVVMVDDACAGLEQQMHDAALRSFAVFAGRVETTSKVIELTSHTRV